MSETEAPPSGAAEGPPGAAAEVPVEWKGATYKPLADGKYDVIICGTGLKECILSGLLSVKGKKVRGRAARGMLARFYCGAC